MSLLASLGAAFGLYKNGQQIMETAKDIVSPLLPETTPETTAPASTAQQPSKSNPLADFEGLDHYNDGYQLGYSTQDATRFDSGLRKKRSIFQHINSMEIETLKEQRAKIREQQRKQAGTVNFNPEFFEEQLREIDRKIEMHSEEIAKSELNEGRFKHVYASFNDGFMQGLGDFNDENSFFNRG